MSVRLVARALGAATKRGTWDGILDKAEVEAKAARGTGLWQGLSRSLRGLALSSKRGTESTRSRRASSMRRRRSSAQERRTSGECGGVLLEMGGALGDACRSDAMSDAMPDAMSDARERRSSAGTQSDRNSEATDARWSEVERGSQVGVLRVGSGEDVQ